jgi:hypothetical protein
MYHMSCHCEDPFIFEGINVYEMFCIKKKKKKTVVCNTNGFFPKLLKKKKKNESLLIHRVMSELMLISRPVPSLPRIGYS